jgi:hypothetical protein
LDNANKVKISFEISQIDKLLNDSKPLFDLCKIREPDFIELQAAAMILHSFYNGIENILVLIFKGNNEALPGGSKWHMDLLEAAFSKTTNRKAIFNNDLQPSLEEYMKFRHFVRHTYGFQLQWDKMIDLVNNLSDMWNKIKEDLNVFMGT